MLALLDQRTTGKGHALLLTCMLCGAACVDDSGNDSVLGGGGEQPGDGGGGSGGAGGADGLVVTVHVTKSTQTAPAGFEDAAGATVAVDLPDGTRVELSTDEGGQAVFVLPATAATIDVIGYLEGYGLNGTIDVDTKTFVGVPIELVLRRPGAAPSSVFGSAVAMKDPTHTLLVSSSTFYPSVASQGPDWSLQVEPNTALHVCGLELLNVGATQRGFSLEHYGWALAEAGPLSRPGEVVLDFTRRLATRSFSGSVLLPTGDGELAQLATTSLAVRAYANHMLVGAPTRVDVSEDGERLEYEASHLELPGEELITTVGLSGPGGQGASLSLVGTPEGAQDVMLPEAPVIDANVTRHTHDQIEWPAHPSNAGMRPILYIAHDGTYSIVRAPFDATHVRVPALPSTAGTLSIDGPALVEVYDGLETSAGLIAGRRAFSRSFTIEP